MKHFLPRVLELVNNFDFPCHSPEIVFSRLGLEKTEYWPSEERQLLHDFSLLFFRKCLSIYPSPSYESIDTYLVMFGSAYFDLNLLLTEWKNTKTLTSLLHFKDLVWHRLKYQAQIPIKLNNAFSEPFVNTIILDWLSNKNTKKTFSVRIENEIVNNERLSQENLNELSWIYEMLVK